MVNDLPNEDFEALAQPAAPQRTQAEVTKWLEGAISCCHGDGVVCFSCMNDCPAFARALLVLLKAAIAEHTMLARGDHVGCGVCVARDEALRIVSDAMPQSKEA